MGIPAPAGVSASGLPPAGDQANAVISGLLTAVGPSKPFAFRGPMNLVLYASYNSALTTTAGSLNASVAAAGAIAAGDAINSVNVPPGTTWATFDAGEGTLALPTISMRGRPNAAQRQIFDLESTSGLIGASVSLPGASASFATVTGIVQAAIAPNGASPGQRGIIQLSAAPAVPTPQNDPVAYEFALTASAVTGGVDNNAIFTGAAITWTGSAQIERCFDGGKTWIVCSNAGQLAQFTTGAPVSITFGEPEREVLYRINVTALTGGNINYRISQTGGAAESLAIGPLSGG